MQETDAAERRQFYYGFSQSRTGRPKQRTTSYAGACRKLYKKISKAVQ